MQGLLRGAVGGLQQVMRRGAFSIPASVAEATERFKVEADPMRGFIEERIAFGGDNAMPRTEVYSAYTTWAVVNGFHQMSAQRFYESFLAASTVSTQQPLRDVRLNGTRVYRGLSLQ